MKKILYTAFLLLMLVCLGAKAIEVNKLRHYGPLRFYSPLVLDSVNVEGNSIREAKLIDTPVNLKQIWKAPVVEISQLQRDTVEAVHLIGFTVSSTSYVKASVSITGLTNTQLFVDEQSSKMDDIELLPQTHRFVIKYVPAEADTAALSITITSKDSIAFTLGDGSEDRLLKTDDLFCGWGYGSHGLSADGKWMSVSKYSYKPGGGYISKDEIREVATNRVVDNQSARWMPRSIEYYYTRTEPDGSLSLVAKSPVTLKERILAPNLPKGGFVMSPSEDYLIFYESKEGPKERQDVFEVLTPDDRQSGWRNRMSLSFYDLATGTTQPLTFGHRNSHLQDISRDGRKLLISCVSEDYTQRPYQKQDVMLIILPSTPDGELRVDTIVRGDGFINDANFSPDGKKVLFRGSAEAFNRIGCTIPDDKFPNIFDVDMFIMDLEGEPQTGTTNLRPVKAITRNFNPNVTNAVWSASDGMIYLSTEDKDYIHLYQYNPKTEKYTLINVPEEVVRDFDVASNAPVLACNGEGTTNKARLYTVDMRNLKVKMHEDLSAERFDGVKLGEYNSWIYTTPEGEDITCGYCLPADFDPTRKYPMIVHYYGGCSPTSRYFGGGYSPQLYAAHGYIALIVNPSGAAGFGQEFASRHVQTAGQRVSDDIIGATKEFCRQHSYVNDAKVGCISASYGGFMTQYMLTETYFFATGVSHAGISSHAGYWGEGYWGFSYSEVSMGDSYPWNDTKLYVEQSPLFRADRIHTPLLFTHGTADTNVPPSESIQMFTALKRTGCPTALIMVEGENHGISDYNKRDRWINSIMAWFDRWLKDEPLWWQSLYKDKEL